MENASKALLIAGGVLIAILVMTLGVYFSRSIADYTSRVYAQLEESKRTEFNQQFFNFTDKLKKVGSNWVADTITIQDVATLINLAKDSNKYNDLDEMMPPMNPSEDTSLYVTVLCDTSLENIKAIVLEENAKGFTYTMNNAEKFSDEMINKIISKEMNETKKEYKCKVSINNNTGYVNYIEISY